MRSGFLILVLAGCGPTAKAPKTAGPPKVTLEFYDVKDLCCPTPNFGGNDGPNLEPSHYEPPPVDPNDHRPEADDLVDAIRATIDPDSWDTDGRSIASKSRVLVVRTTPDIHERIGRYLADLRAGVTTDPAAAARRGS